MAAKNNGKTGTLVVPCADRFLAGSSVPRNDPKRSATESCTGPLQMICYLLYRLEQDKYDYRMVGHSGTGPEAERLVEWGRPPRSDPWLC